jgi:hypothetical protein
MSNIALTPNASGTGTFTLASPNSNTNRTLTLPDADGIIFNQGNILGTVSQSAGVPTGSILESGSNANGEYVKYADGTMICWNYALTTQASSTDTGSMFRTLSTATWTFPVAFLVAPVVTGQADNSARIMAIELPTTTAVDFRQFSATTSAGLIGVRLTAIGQWY